MPGRLLGHLARIKAYVLLRPISLILRGGQLRASFLKRCFSLLARVVEVFRASNERLCDSPSLAKFVGRRVGGVSLSSLCELPQSR